MLARPGEEILSLDDAAVASELVEHAVSGAERAGQYSALAALALLSCRAG
jgi:hypothetical protein